MEPARERGAVLQVHRMLCQCQKHTLRHIFGQARIAHDPQGCGVNEINMAMHQFAKRGFATIAGICAKQNLVAVVCHSLIIHCRNQNRTALILLVSVVSLK